jgi:hypothetical protein
MSGMSDIILIQDIYKLKEEKEKELKFYQERLEELNRKMFFIKKEIELTGVIIDLIEREKVEDIRNLVKK